MKSISGKYISHKCCLILLILEVSVFLLLNALWERESYFFLYHEAINHAISVCCMTSSPAEPFKINVSNYPLLIPYFSHLLLYIVPSVKWCLFLTQSFFVVINVFATYFLSVKLTKINSISFWAASALLWLPASVASSRTYTLDYPLAAELTLWCLCYECSKNKRLMILPIICFCALFFIMLLTKYSFIIYVIPCAMAMLYDLRGNRRRIVTFITGMAFLCVLGYLLFHHLTSNNNLNAYIDNIWFTNCNFNIPLAKIFPIVSLFLRGVIIEYKMRILSVIVFWFFSLGFIIIILSPKLRKKYVLLITPCLISMPIILFSSNDCRYHYPFLSFSCIIAGVFMQNKRLLRIISLFLILFHGLFLSGGWMFDCPSLTAKTLRICSNLELNVNKGLQVAIFDIRINNELKKNIIEFRNGNSLDYLFNFSSSYSDNLFYTFKPYELDLFKEFSFVLSLPENARVKVVSSDIPPESLDLPSHVGQMAYLIYYLSIVNRHVILISDQESNPDYILQYYPCTSGLVSLSDDKKSVDIADKISGSWELMQSRDISNYTMNLYKRK